MNKPGALSILVLSFAALAAAACAGPASVVGPPPTAAEILKRPVTADYKDAHFTLKIHTSSGAFTLDLTGDGTIVRKPAEGLQMHYQGSLGAIPLAYDLISVGGKEYSRAGTEKWSVKDGSVPLTPEDWSKASDAKLVAEETVNGSKAWHVTATQSSGPPFDVWVRESDGYPLKFVSNGSPTATTSSPATTGSAATSSGTFELDFDKFNTGTKIQAPPAAEVKSG
jgi:hypothetical protein